MKLSILGIGSLIGEEDVIWRGRHSCTVKCYSLKGTLFMMKKENFSNLKTSDQSWLSILEKIIQKESQQHGFHINATPRDFEKEDRYE